MLRNKNGQVRSGWLIAGMMLASIIIITIVGSIIAFIAGIIFSGRMITNGKIDIQNFRLTDQETNIINITLMYIQEVVLIMVPIIGWRFIIRRPLSNMGLIPLKKHAKELLTGLLFGIISISVVFTLLILTKSASVESWIPEFSIEQLINLPLYILVGFAEEIYSRGYTMSALRRTGNTFVVVIVSSVIFSVMHSSNSGIGMLPYINLMLAGILFAYMYLKSGNLWMCIGYHITWNYFQGYVYGFKVSGMKTYGIISTSYESGNILNGGAFGPEGGLFVTAVMLAGLIFVRYYYRNHTFDFIATEGVTSTSANAN